MTNMKQNVKGFICFSELMSKTQRVFQLSSYYNELIYLMDS